MLTILVLSMAILIRKRVIKFKIRKEAYIMKKILAIFLVLSFCTLLTGCFGQSKIEKDVEKNHQDLKLPKSICNNRKK